MMSDADVDDDRDRRRSSRSVEPSAGLAGRLRRLRQRAGYSLRELEQASGISDSSWSRYLSGRGVPPWSAVETLCRLAGHDPADLRNDWQSEGGSRLNAAGGNFRQAPTQLLAARLRQLRHTSGQTLKQLERSVHISDSALSRYLSGRVTPPWPIVRALCQLAGQDPGRLHGLWEQARDTRRMPVHRRADMVGRR